MMPNAEGLKRCFLLNLKINLEETVKNAASRLMPQ